MAREVLTGIYKITNVVNNKVYIGQSKDINKRWYSHRSELNGNKHNNEHLQNSWNKYGCDSFKFEIVELCEQSELNNKEIYWIDYYDSSNPDLGYNLTKGGDGTLGRVVTEEEKMKIYLSHNSEEIVQLTIDGKFVNRWRSAAYASRALNIPTGGIRGCVKHDASYYTCHNYIWVLASEYDNGLFDYESYKHEHLDYYLRPISKYDLYGNKIAEWDCQAKIKESDNVMKRLKSILNHTTRQADGYIYAYSDDIDFMTEDYLRDCRIKSYRYKVKQFDLDYNYIRTYTIEEIENLPFRTKTILKCCSNRYANTKGGIYRAFGYIWEYD